MTSDKSAKCVDESGRVLVNSPDVTEIMCSPHSGSVYARSKLRIQRYNSGANDFLTITDFTPEARVPGQTAVEAWSIDVSESFIAAILADSIDRFVVVKAVRDGKVLLRRSLSDLFAAGDPALLPTDGCWVSVNGNGTVQFSVGGPVVSLEETGETVPRVYEFDWSKNTGRILVTAPGYELPFAWSPDVYENWFEGGAKFLLRGDGKDSVALGDYEKMRFVLFHLAGIALLAKDGTILSSIGGKPNSLPQIVLTEARRHSRIWVVAAPPSTS